MSTDLTAERRREIAARCARATAGPWQWDAEGYAEKFEPGAKCPHGSDYTGHGPDLMAPNVKQSYTSSSGEVREYPTTVIAGYGFDAWGLDIEKADADFIAHAREDLPLVLAALDRAEARVAVLEAAGDRMAKEIESQGPYDILGAAEAWQALRGTGEVSE